MPRTSLSHPLTIDTLACSNGIVGMTLCPGKKGPSLTGEVWDRDLKTDLQAIEAWGPDVVVTLMEPHEFGMLGIPEAPLALEAMAAEWSHLPIADVSTPDETFERRWIYHGHRLRGVLRRGGKVLLHCRGGLGRTGSIAARLLVEFGAAPESAIRAVRAARPNAIETREQEAWVRALTPPAFDDARADKVLGCLLGGAIGDAFGYAVEFKRLPQIRRDHGPEGLTEPVLHEGRLVVSDDTQMTLFTADGLARAIAAKTLSEDEITQSIRSAYQAWLQTQGGAKPTSVRFDDLRRFWRLWARRAPGNTCVSALAAGGNGGLTTPINDSKGCGGVMRTAPIGLVEGVGGDRAFRLGARAAALTHGHPSGHLSAGALAGMISDLISGADLPTSLATARMRLGAYAGHEETSRALARAVDLAKETLRPEEAVAALGLGWVGEEALAIAVYAALTATDFPGLARIAANHSGDSDSTASIAGQIWGAQHGASDMPPAWVGRLDVLDPICEVARSLLSLALPGDGPASKGEAAPQAAPSVEPPASRLRTLKSGGDQILGPADHHAIGRANANCPGSAAAQLGETQHLHRHHGERSRGDQGFVLDGPEPCLEGHRLGAGEGPVVGKNLPKRCGLGCAANLSLNEFRRRRARRRAGETQRRRRLVEGQQAFSGENLKEAIQTHLNQKSFPRRVGRVSRLRDEQSEGIALALDPAPPHSNNFSRWIWGRAFGGLGETPRKIRKPVRPSWPREAPRPSPS